MAKLIKTSIGESLHLTDSAEGKAVEFALYGKATQDGEPTPENPQEIEVSGESGSVIVTSSNEYNTKTTTAIIPTPNGLAGIKVSSGGNYTDQNGQQWICDEIVKYADGSGEYINRITIDTFVGESSEGWVAQLTGTKRFQTKNFKATPQNKEILCNKYINNNASVNSLPYYYCKISDFLYVTDDRFETLEEFLADLSVNPLVVAYRLAEPIHTQLTAEEIAEIEKLHTFYPVTNISNDFDCGMSVTYISNVIEWENPNTYWKKTDRFNISDFNRIKNNLMYLHNVALVRVGAFEIESMGEEYIVGVDEYKNWLVEDFNAIENNLHTISKKIIDKDIGAKKTFYENGLMPDFAELNRIETVILNNKNALDNLSAGIRRIPFRLGQYKTRF